MAMINCKDCGKEVSDTALKCPSCGVQLRKAKRTVMGKAFLLLFIFFNILKNRQCTIIEKIVMHFTILYKIIKWDVIKEPQW